MNDDLTKFPTLTLQPDVFTVTTFGASPRPDWLDDERFASWAVHAAGWPRSWKAAKTSSRNVGRPETLISTDGVHDVLALPEVEGQPFTSPVFAWTLDDGEVRSLGFGAFRVSWDRRRGVLQCMWFMNHGWRPTDPMHSMDAVMERVLLQARTIDSTFLRALTLTNDTFQHAPWEWSSHMHVVPLREFPLVAPHEFNASSLLDYVQATLLADGLTDALHQRMTWVMQKLRTWRREEPMLRRWFDWGHDASTYDSTWLGRMGWLQRPQVLQRWSNDVGHRSRWAHLSGTALLAGDDPNAFSAAYWLCDDNGYQWWSAVHHFQWNSSRTLRWSRTASPAIVRALTSTRALRHGAGEDFLWHRLQVMALADVFAEAGIVNTPLAAARMVTGLRMETVFLAWTHLHPEWTVAFRAANVFPNLHLACFQPLREMLNACEKASPLQCAGLYRALVAWLNGARERGLQWAPGWVARAKQAWERLTDKDYQANFPWDKVQVTWRWETFQDRIEQGFADDADRFWNHDVGYDARNKEAVWGSSLGMVVWNGVNVIPVCREERLRREGDRFLNCLRQGDRRADMVALALANERRFFRLEHNGLLALLELKRERTDEPWHIGQLEGVANRTLADVFADVAQRVLVAYNALDSMGDMPLVLPIAATAAADAKSSSDEN